jgi:uncharacterized protein YukE
VAFPVFCPFLVPSAVATSTWSVMTIGGFAAAMLTIAAFAEADADDKKLDAAAAAWRAAKSEIDQLKEKFHQEAVPPVTSWDGTNDRQAFDTLVSKIEDELASLSKVYEDNAKALESAKDFYNMIVISVLAMALAVAGIMIALQALKALLVSAPGAEAAQTVTAWSYFGAVVGVLTALLGGYQAVTGFLKGSEIKFSKDVDKDMAGGDVKFDDITIDWGSMRDEPVLS